MGVTTENRGGAEVIKIPYNRFGKTVNNKYKGIKEKHFSQDANAEKCFYNYDVIIFIIEISDKLNLIAIIL